MNSQVCQSCGALLRGANSKCSSCGSVVTKFSATGVAVLNGMAPAAVALKQNPLQAERMILDLQHDVPDTFVPDKELQLLYPLAEEELEPVAAEDPVPIVAESRPKVRDFFSDAPTVQRSVETAERAIEPEPVQIKENKYLDHIPEPQGPQQVWKEPQAIPQLKQGDETAALMQRLVDAQMNGTLPQEATFFEQVEKKNVSRRKVSKKNSGDESKEISRKSASKTGASYFSSLREQVSNIIPFLIAGFLLSGIVALFAFAFALNNKPAGPVSAASIPDSVAEKRVYRPQPNTGMRIGDWRRVRMQSRPQPRTESNWFDGFKNIFWNDNEPAASRFLKILFGFILAGLGIVKLSLKFFGRNGWLNLREREKYITAACRPRHLKMIKEMGRARKKGSLYLGERADWNLMQFLPRKMYLPPIWRERNPHFLALGAGAKGKTRLLASMAVNDIRSEDRAVVIVDSEGSLTELILRWLGTQHDAKDLLERVSLIDPCRSECKLGFNPFCSTNTDNLQALASSIVMGFKSVYTETQNQQNQWAEQTTNILRNSVLLLILNEQSLNSLPTLLSDNDFRDVLLERVEKNHSREWSTLLEAWSNYKKLARSEQWLTWIEPILNRVQPLLSDQRINRLLNVKDGGVDLNQVLNEKRILLVRVPEGQLEKGGDLLGSLIITGLKHAALMHFESTGDAPEPCSLYVENMNNFIDAKGFESICSDLRKVQIGIHGSLKTLQDIPEDYRNKVQVLLGSMALFSMSKKDADTIGPVAFKVDGGKIINVGPKDVFAPISANPNMRMASEEEKIHIGRLVGQDERCYFFHVVGTDAGTFRMKAPEFQDITRGDVNWELLESLYDQADLDDED